MKFLNIEYWFRGKLRQLEFIKDDAGNIFEVRYKKITALRKSNTKSAKYEKAE